MKTTAHGQTHGEAPPGPPFIAIKLKDGWALAPDGASVHGGARRVTPSLPAGASLVPAIPVPVPPGGRLTKAERELTRFVHLRLPAGASLDDALALARSWEFVERADRPPSVSLP
jgi:hypothetical protein